MSSGVPNMERSRRRSEILPAETTCTRKIMEYVFRLAQGPEPERVKHILSGSFVRAGNSTISKPWAGGLLSQHDLIELRIAVHAVCNRGKSFQQNSVIGFCDS
jgi:hypothetical protein